MIIQNKLKFIPYQDSFKDAFLAYKKKLHIILKDVRNSITHFGSTAIPQTIGKGVIDIMIILNDNKTMLKTKKILEQAGYFCINNNKNKKRIFLATNPIESQPFDAHIHLVIKNTPEHKNPLKFVRALNENPQLVKKYNKLKLKLFRETDKNRRLYTQEKGDFIKQITNIK
jgi:GrpB-like predicted nucleotidyltransferase (UPF0157 family)